MDNKGGEMDGVRDLEYSCVKDEGWIVAVFRLYYKGTGLYTERWDIEKKTWVDYPALLKAEFIGGDTDFEKATEKEVTEFIKRHS